MLESWIVVRARGIVGVVEGWNCRGLGCFVYPCVGGMWVVVGVE